MNDPKYKNSLGFTDLLFNILIGVFVMFFIAFILISPEGQDRNINSLVQYRITIEWEIDNPDDVDIWVEDPLENLVWYNARDKGLMHLDRDDRGEYDDWVIGPDGKKIESRTNAEIFSIRETIPGEYIANIHMYNKNRINPTKVIGNLEQVDPYKVLDTVEIWLKGHKEERLLFRFTLDKKGDIISRSKVFKTIVTPYGEIS